MSAIIQKQVDHIHDVADTAVDAAANAAIALVDEAKEAGVEVATVAGNEVSIVGGEAHAAVEHGRDLVKQGLAEIKAVGDALAGMVPTP